MVYVTFKSFYGHCPYLEDKHYVKAKYRVVDDNYLSLLFVECELEYQCGVNDCPVKQLAPKILKT